MSIFLLISECYVKNCHFSFIICLLFSLTLNSLHFLNHQLPLIDRIANQLIKVFFEIKSYQRESYQSAHTTPPKSSTWWFWPKQPPCMIETRPPMEKARSRASLTIDVHAAHDLLCELFEVEYRSKADQRRSSIILIILSTLVTG